MSFYAISAIINAVLSSAIGIFVFRKNWKNPIYLTYSLFCLSVSVWSYSYFLWQISTEELHALLYCRLLMAGAMFTPVFYFHHILALSNRLAEKRKVLTFGYCFVIAASIANLTPSFVVSVSPKLGFEFWPNPGAAFNVFLPIWGGFVLYGLYIILQTYKTSRGLLHNQMKYLLVATLIGWTGGATNYPLWYNIPIPPIGNILVSVYVIIVAYAIVTQRLMGIEILLKRGFLLITTVILSSVAGYASFNIGENLLKLTPQLNIGIAAAFMLAVFGLLLTKVNAIVFTKEDLRLFALKEASRQMVIFPNPTKLSREICKRIHKTFDASFVKIYLRRRIAERGRKLGSMFTPYDPIIRWFLEIRPNLVRSKLLDKRRADMLHYHEIAESWLLDEGPLKRAPEARAVLQEVKTQMEITKAIVVVGSFYKRNLYGLMLLGEKRGGFYTPADLDILSSLSTIAAMNIRNAIIIEELHSKVRDKTKLFREMRGRTIQMVFAFNRAIDARDQYTSYHSKEIKEIGDWIAQEMGIEMTSDLEFGLQLHDLGKIGVPDAILRKPGKLNEEEVKMMRKHPKLGFEILRHMDLFKNVAEITYAHQERYDGAGYPRGLKGEEIPLAARIIAVADAYHAMTSEKPYRDKIPAQDIVRELLKGRGTQFDPNVIDALIRKLVKIRSISKKQLKHIIPEEGLASFDKSEDFLNQMLASPNSSAS